MGSVSNPVLNSVEPDHSSNSPEDDHDNNDTDKYGHRFVLPLEGGYENLPMQAPFRRHDRTIQTCLRSEVRRGGCEAGNGGYRRYSPCRIARSP